MQWPPRSQSGDVAAARRLARRLLGRTTTPPDATQAAEKILKASDEQILKALQEMGLA